eukprot:gene13316-16233_t
MEFLNQIATIVFSKLIDSLNGQQHRKILNDPYMSLTLEMVGQYIETPWGLANLYSLCHYYKQNGDLMQDPEMCFFSIDSRGDFKADYSKIVIAPYMYQNASIGYQESVRMENQKLTTFNKKRQKEHTIFANTWLLMKTTFNFQINPDNNHKDWDNVAVRTKLITDRVTAVQLARRMARHFK